VLLLNKPWPWRLCRWP